jgi:CSLREA domain-containing protein
MFDRRVLTSKKRPSSQSAPVAVASTVFSTGFWKSCMALCFLLLFSLTAVAQTAHFDGITNTSQINWGEDLPVDLTGVAAAPNGGVYLADQFSGVIFVIQPGGGASWALDDDIDYITDMAADNSGNLYFNENFGSTIWEWQSTGGLTTPGGGFNNVTGVAVDGSGNVYVSEAYSTPYEFGNGDFANVSVVKVMPPGCASSSCVTRLTLTTLDSSGNYVSGIGYAHNLTVDSVGNVYVVDDHGAVASIPAGCSSVTCVTRLGGGLGDWPNDLAVYGNNIFVTDTDPINNTGALKVIPTNCTSASCVITLASGGFWGVSVDRNGSIYLTNSFSLLTSIATAPVFPATAVGATSSPLSLSFTLDSGGKIGAPRVLTQGASSLDFQPAASGSTCTAGTTYNAGDSCTVEVTFAPKYPGLRLGAVQLTDSGGNVIATANVSGTGMGAQIAFMSDAAESTLGGSFGYTMGVATDSSGNVYVADFGNKAVKKIPSGCNDGSCVKTLTGGEFGFGGPSGVAVDGSGNVYVSDDIGNKVYVIPANCVSGSCVTALGGGFKGPNGVAVDGAGNVYVADNGSAVVKKIVPGCTSSGCVTSIGGGLGSPQGVAVDANGNVYIADVGETVKEIPSGCMTSSCVIQLGGGFEFAYGVAVDAGGDVYVADSSHMRAAMIPPGCTSSSCVTTLASDFYAPNGVAVDGAGNVYVADTMNSRVRELAYQTPPSLNFAATNVDAISTDSPQTVAIHSIGNQTLQFSAVTVPDNFLLDGLYTNGTYVDGADTCISTTALNAGMACALAVDFAPLVTGNPLTGNLTLTTNNSTTTAQSIALSGIGQGASEGSQTITFNSATLAGSLIALPTSRIYPGAALVFTLNATGGASGNPVVFSLDSTSTPGIAALSGANNSTLTITGFGTVVIDANQSRGQGYADAPQAQQSIRTFADTAAAIAVYSGSSQTTLDGAPFPNPLTVLVTDASGNAVYDATVTFTAPASGPSATLSSATATTDAHGLASVTATANVTVGSYTVSATISNGASADFSLSNLQAPVFVVTTLNDDAISIAGNCNDTSQGAAPKSGCSLRDAIAEVEALRPAYSPTITFAATMTSGSGSSATTVTPSADNPATINIDTGGVLYLDQKANIVGPGANLLNIASANYSNVILDIDGHDHSILHLSGLTLTGGWANLYVGYGATVFLADCAITNGSSDASAVGITNSGNLTINNCTISGNLMTVDQYSLSDGDGGGIYNDKDAVLTITNSTISGNSAGTSGGGISNWGTATITNSTISGNSAGTVGGGISNQTGGTLTISNSIVAGNTVTSQYADMEGGYIDGGGNLIGTAPSATSLIAANLAPLANYGGPTQTMLPQLGSAAICAGLAADIPSGMTTDQRGFARINSTYENGTACVDAGAVQTHYALAFAAEPPSYVQLNQAITPAPVVTLTESATAATAATSDVALTDSAALLTGTTTLPLSAGAASFGNLLLPSTALNDKLTATLALSTTLNLTAQSTAFSAETAVPATILTPTPGSTLTASPVNFTWTTGVDANYYSLTVGDQFKGSYNLYQSGSLHNKTSVSVSLPINGENLYVRLCSYIANTWQCNDYNYTSSGTPVLATLTSPAPGSTITSSSATFQWSAGAGVTNYILNLGSTGPGSHDLYTGASTTATSANVTGLPTNGLPIYVRLFSQFNGSWAQYNDYVLNPPTAATLTSPVQGATLAATGQSFTWAPVAGATSYNLYLGTSAGSGNLLDAGASTATTVTANNLPINGEPIYARLWTNFNGTWKYNDYTFTAAAPAALTSPLGATITAAGQTFTWTPVGGVTGYTLYLGNTGTGSGNLVDAHTTGSSVTSGKLPAGTINARLWTNFNGVWKYNDYTFTAQ